MPSHDLRLDLDDLALQELQVLEQPIDKSPKHSKWPQWPPWHDARAACAASRMGDRVAACVYHMCSVDFRGEVLYSLSGLQSVHRDLYERERVKYEGREGVLRYRVPGLDVTWTETVNLSALHPKYLVAERRRLGVPFSNLLTRRVLEIPVERLSGLKAVAYTSSAHWINSMPNDPSAPTEPPLEDFFPFDAASHREPTTVPPLHTEYLLLQSKRGEPALGFVFVPHVLVASAIDISGLVKREIA